MNKIYILIFIFLAGCASPNKVYICGDHKCKNKKEIDDYFKNNISVEVYVVESKKMKDKDQNLVQLNILSEKDSKKEKKELAFLSKRKDVKKNEINKDKPTKLKLQVKTDDMGKLDGKKKKDIKKDKNKKSLVSKPNNIFTYKKNKKTKIVHLCKSVDECDINIISKKITESGIEKSFPNINF